jgi:hypothetical protein
MHICLPPFYPNTFFGLKTKKDSGQAGMTEKDLNVFLRMTGAVTVWSLIEKSVATYF